MDPYRVLQVDPAAEPEIIEAAYRRLARKYHPDVYQGRDAETRMREINAAHTIIGDAAERRRHDRARADARTRRRGVRRFAVVSVPGAEGWRRGTQPNRRTTPFVMSTAVRGMPIHLRWPLPGFGAKMPPIRSALIGVAIAVGLAAVTASVFAPEERAQDDRESGAIVVVESRAAPSPTAIAYARREMRAQSEFPPTLPRFPSSGGNVLGTEAAEWLRRLIGRPRPEARIAGPRTPDRPTIDPIMSR